MSKERKGLIQLGGNDVTVVGEDIRVGQAAPDFSAHALDWSVVRALADTPGKVRIIAAVPSLDTEVCDRETRRFNQEALPLRIDHDRKDFVARHSCRFGLRDKSRATVDRQGKVTYAVYMPALGVEPNYPEVLQAAQAALL